MGSEKAFPPNIFSNLRENFPQNFMYVIDKFCTNVGIEFFFQFFLTYLFFGSLKQSKGKRGRDEFTSSNTYVFLRSLDEIRVFVNFRRNFRFLVIFWGYYQLFLDRLMKLSVIS